MNNKPHSPFYILQDFLSPLLCEQVVDDLNFIYPNKNADGQPIKFIRSHERSEDIIFQHLLPHISNIEKHYNIQYRGTTPMSFEWYPQGAEAESPRCENSEYIKKQWVRTRDRDLTGILFFSDYQDQVPFDGDFEVYGSKIEFFQHRFGFNPQRGTLILFPSDPHFLNAATSVNAGDSFQVRFHIAANTPFMYNPSDFPGDYTTWFEEIA